MSKASGKTSAIRDLAWALVAWTLVLAVVLPALLVGIAAHYVLAAPHLVRLGLSGAAWALFATGAALGTALLLGLPLRRSEGRMAALVAVAGALAAATASAGVAGWAYLKWGRVELELIGPSMLLALPLAMLTAAAVAWLVTFGLAQRLAAVATAGALVLLGLMALADTRGLADGLHEWSWPLVVTYAVAAGFVALVLGTLWLSRRRRAAREAARGA